MLKLCFLLPTGSGVGTGWERDGIALSERVRDSSNALFTKRVLLFPSVCILTGRIAFGALPYRWGGGKEGGGNKVGVLNLWIRGNTVFVSVLSTQSERWRGVGGGEVARDVCVRSYRHCGE